MKIQVTEEDILRARQGPIENPMTCALRRMTGRKWFIFRGETASEMEPPYRTIALPYEVQARWQRYHITGVIEPFEFEFAMPPAPCGEERRLEERRIERRQRQRRDGQRRQRERRQKRENGGSSIWRSWNRRQRQRRQWERRVRQRRRSDRRQVGL